MIEHAKRLLRSLMMHPCASQLALKSLYSGRWGWWIRDHDCAATFDHPEGIHKFLIALPELQGPINYLEFGVHQGRSLRWWVEGNRDSRSTFVGFDSFEGLPEHWMDGFGKGHFSTGGQPPQIDDPRCSFAVGWFNQTLPPRVENLTLVSAPTVIHADGDLYSSTMVVLFGLAAKIKIGDILILDDFSDSLNVFRAFLDFLSAYPIGYELIAKGERYTRVALRVTAPVPSHA